MRLQNTTPANLGVRAVSHEDSRADHTHLVVPGDSTIELDDEQWINHFRPECDKLLAAGNFVVLDDVPETEEEMNDREDAQYRAAKAFVDAREARDAEEAELLAEQGE